MFCQKCGKELVKNAKFCTGCGTAVERLNETINITTRGFMSRREDGINYTGVIASVVAFISLFLPFLTFRIWGFTKSISLYNYSDEKISLILIVVTGLMYVLRKDKIAFTVAIMNLVIVLYDWMEAIKFLDKSFIMGQLSFGFYLCLFSSIVMVGAYLISKLAKIVRN